MSAPALLPPPPISEAPRSFAPFCNKCAQRGHTTWLCLTFKTRPCKFFQQGRCIKPAALCLYAHGEHELRPSSFNWCTRVTYENGVRTVEGCGNPGHTIKTCQQGARGLWLAADERKVTPA